MTRMIRILRFTAPAILLLTFGLGGCSSDNSAEQPDAADTAATAKVRGSMFAGRAVTLAEASIAPGQDSLVLTIEPPIGYDFTHDVPSQLEFRSSDHSVLTVGTGESGLKTTAAEFPLTLPFTAEPGRATVSLDATIFFCEKGSTVCVFDKVHVEVPVTVSAGAGNRLAIHIDAQGPEDL